MFALSRCRWQVELAFQRIKTLLDLDALRTQQNSRWGEVWIRGKWLDAWVIERRAQRHAAGGFDPLDRPRRRRLQTLPARVIEMMKSKGGNGAVKLALLG